MINYLNFNNKSFRVILSNIYTIIEEYSVFLTKKVNNSVHNADNFPIKKEKLPEAL